MAGVAAVLPAYLLGLAMSRSLNERKEAWSKVRTVFLGFMVSLFFLAAGSNVSMEALLAGAAIIIGSGLYIWWRESRGRGIAVPAGAKGG